MNLQQIPINKIRLGKNSRLNIRDEELVGLMESIKESGLLQAIGLRKDKSGYQIAYGNRRFLAMSKLGKKKIPANVVDEKSTQSDIDIMNLAENVQRRSLSITEIGRYISLLHEKGISFGEIAIRLGTPKAYIKTCLSVFQKVPTEFRPKVKSQFPGNKVKPGEIALTTVNRINTVVSKYRLNSKDTKRIYSHALKEDFDPNQVDKYALALKRDPKADLKKSVKKQMELNLHFYMDRKEYDVLWNKHILNGPFRSMRALGLAVFRGQKALNIKTLK